MKIDNILADSAKHKQLVLVVNSEYEAQIVQDLNDGFKHNATVNKKIHEIISELIDSEKATISQIREQLSVSCARVRITGFPDYYYSILEIKDFLRCIIDVSPFSLFREYIISQRREGGFCFPKMIDETYSYTDGIIPCVNLFGDIGNHNDFILEIDKYEEFIQDSSKSICTGLQDRINGICLFVGFNPNFSNFQDTIKFLCRKNAEYSSESYLLTKNSAEKYLKRMKLKIINCDYSNFFKEILNLKTHEHTKKIIKNKDKISPYKYLDSFEEGDTDIFFGRSSETDELSKRIKSQNQVHILVSSSGFGKTSLIRAGIIPKIKSTNEYSIYYLRSRSDTYESIINEINAQGDKINNDYKIETVSQYQLIIIDQFEEFFVLGNDSKTELLDKKLNKLLQKNTKLKLLFVIREDFYFKMIGMTIDSNLSVRKFYLKPFLGENAKEAIIQPAQLFGYQYEEGLVDEIISDLLEINDYDEKKAFIDPSQLQIVCFTLVNILHDQKIITEKLYNLLNGVKGILADYIDNSFKDFAGEDKEKFRCILKSMVSSAQTKIPVKSQQINDYFRLLKLEESDKNINKMLAHLIDARLIRSYAINGETFYELTHEYIIKKISEWMDAESIFIKQTQEKIRLSCDNSNPLHYTFSQTLLEDIEKFKNKLILNEKEKSRILLKIILEKIDVLKNKDTLKFWIENNVGNQTFYDELKILLENDTNVLIGKKRITSCFALYCTFGHKDTSCYSFIISVLEKHVNPHFNFIYKIFGNMGFSIESDFVKECNQLLDKKRTANMAKIMSGTDAVLGIDEKQRKKIIQKNSLPDQLKNNIPAGIRKWSNPEYWIDIFLVTNKDYAEFKESHIYKENEGMFPVVNLSYEEAEEYAKWWNKSIPSEDEWEYAARGKDQRFFPWGDEWPIDEDKKCKDETDKCCNTSITGHDGLTKVGIYKNGDSFFKCKDMAGNVWEWTVTSPTINGKSEPDKVIVKGGSWSLFDVYPWTWYQFYYKKDNGYHNVGFRCVYRVSK